MVLNNDQLTSGCGNYCEDVGDKPGKLEFNSVNCLVPRSQSYKFNVGLLSVFREIAVTLPWRHYELAGVSNHQPHDCLPKRLFTRRSKKTSKLRIAGRCVGNSSVTGDLPAQRTSNAENVSIWWRHHETANLTYQNKCWLSSTTADGVNRSQWVLIISAWGHNTFLTD